MKPFLKLNHPQGMDITRQAEAKWEGTVTEGKGHLKLGSGVWEGPYNFKMRAESEPGTNPEELIGAAHAGCFTMALSAQLTEAGFKAIKLETVAKVHLSKDEIGFVIPSIELETEAEVPEITREKFEELAQAAKKNCPVSRALAGTSISLKAILIS